MKKQLIIATSIAALFLAIALVPFGSASAETSGDWTYENLSDGTVSITGYSGTDAVLVIPSTLDGKSVSAIGNEAFRTNTTLTGVTLPDSVTNLGENAFRDCYKLETINLNNITSIGATSFRGCQKLANVELSENLTALGAGAFMGCIALTEITIPDSLTIIHHSTFQNSTNLASVSIGSGVTGISNRAFQKTGLREITIPSNVRVLNDNVFSETPLETAKVYYAASLGVNVFPEETQVDRYVILTMGARTHMVTQGAVPGVDLTEGLTWYQDPNHDVAVDWTAPLHADTTYHASIVFKSSPPAATNGEAYTYDIVISSSSAATTVTVETLPTWLHWDADAQRLSGTPDLDITPGEYSDVNISLRAAAPGLPDAVHSPVIRVWAVGTMPTATMDILISGTEVTAKYTGAGAVSVKWDMGDGTEIEGLPGEKIIHKYVEVGEYVITLTATNAHGSTTATKTVNVKEVESEDRTVYYFAVLISAILGALLLVVRSPWSMVAGALLIILAVATLIWIGPSAFLDWLGLGGRI